jgi:hypothetical protein
MKPLAHLARRGQRPASPERLGGADGEPGAPTSTDLALLRATPDRSALQPVVAGLPGSRPAGAAGAAAPVLPSDDAYSSERFTVDPNEWGESPGAGAEGLTHPASDERTAPWALLARLVLVVVLGLVAFHHSIVSVFHGITSGSVLVYLLAVPLYAGLASAANNRRPGYQVASGVRRRDVLLGALVCGLALAVTALLDPRLSAVHDLWRIDMLMLWLFLLGATTLTFGSRQVRRSWPFWAVLLLVWPFPVRLGVAAFGGGLGGAVLLVVVVLAVVAYGHRRHDPPRWQVLGSTFAVAAVVTALCALPTHPQRLLWPSVFASVVAALWWAGSTRPRAWEPVPERRVRGSSAVLVGLALLGLGVLPPIAPPPAAPSAPTGITAIAVGPVSVPGFSTTSAAFSTKERRYFGRTSTWQRVHLQQDGSGGRPAPEGREIVVDVISTPRPQSLQLYPVTTTYPMARLSTTPDARLDLGHGVAGELFRAEDARQHVAYTLLAFTWRLPVDMSMAGGYVGPPAQLTQRFTLIAVDGRRAGAAFPEPGNAALDGLQGVLASLTSKGTARAGTGVAADEQLLEETARQLVHQRLTGG